MSDEWLNLPVQWIALLVFLAAYLVAGGIYLVVTRLAVEERARAFKAVSPGLLPPLGIIFGLLVGFIAAYTLREFDNGKIAVASEASALRTAVLLAETLPEEQKTHIQSLINRYIEEAVNQEWPAMAQRRATLSTSPTALFEALQYTLALKPADDGQRKAQMEIVDALQKAKASRIERIVISQAEIGSVVWATILLQGFCTLVAIAMVHSDNRLTCAITLTLFATGIALCVLLLASYSRPFSGAISVGPDLLKQVITSESEANQP
jgi:hypothetical protein